MDLDTEIKELREEIKAYDLAIFRTKLKLRFIGAPDELVWTLYEEALEELERRETHD